MDRFLLTFFIIIFYVTILISLKKGGYSRKEKCDNCNNCCPDCKLALNRVQRKIIDHLLQCITIQIFDYKRYICSNCGWEGLRWER